MDMFQKIILFISLFVFLYSWVYANQKVEDIFIDINSNYKYLSELQTLYDKGIISPNIHNKFKPYELLSREEFVGILMETNCVQCIKPEVNYDLINEFKDEDVYYDVHNNSDYFYCINTADNQWYIQWYNPGTTCENWDSKEWEIPFCPDNTIILEEALAIVMRAWNILSQDQANQIVNNIINGESYPDLSDDVKSKNTDDSVYDFYPYFYKADNFIITEYNNLWKKLEYSLLEKKNEKYYPKKSINREDFLKIAIFTLKNSSCLSPVNNDISWEINIFDGSCSQNIEQCEYENDFNTDEAIDFIAQLETTCLLWFWDEESYKWVINNLSKNIETIQTGKYLDNIVFLDSWKYKVDLFISDLCWNSTKITKNISISSSTEDIFLASINKEYLGEFTLDFTGIITGNTWKYIYKWDFGDGNTSNEQNPNHIYSESGTYDVILTVTDKNWVEKKIPTTVNFVDNDFNAAIWVENIQIWSTDFIQFKGLTNSNNPNLTYKWDFGDGNSSNKKDPLQDYLPWTYEVTLIVTDENWNQKIVTTLISVPNENGNFSIKASVETEEINNGLEVTFIPNINGWVWPYIYSWDLWDGNTSNEEKPKHEYSEPGIYTIELTVTDALWNTKTTYLQVIVTDENWNQKIVTTLITLPDGDWDFSINASVETQEINNGLEASFTPSISGWVWPYTYFWDLWDGNTSNEEKPKHEYSEPGIYTIELTVTDSEWNTQTTFTQVMVSSPSIDTQIITSPDIENTGTFTFIWDIEWWVWPYTYSWDLWDGNTSNLEEPNHSYQENWTYTVTLITVDANWLISTAITTVVVIANTNEHFNIELSWSPLSWPGPLNSKLLVEIQWGTWPFEYKWDFADWSTWVGRNISHTFSEQWTYEVIVSVTDANWVIKTETIIINVGPISSEIDSDKDGILDRNDKCPSIKWKGENEGCPIFEQTCNNDADCNENSLCWKNSKGLSTCIAVAVKNNCEYNGNSTVFWNIICNTCPCQNTLDFNASLRNCDVVFPAITSPDWSEIYSKWNYYQIKK